MEALLQQHQKLGGVYCFTKPGCPYCDKLKAALSALALQHRTICVTSAEESAELKRLTGMGTYPMLFIGQRLVGGYDAFNTMAMTNQLPNLLMQEGVLYSEEWF